MGLTWVLYFLFKVQIKNELPLLAGDYVLGYYSTNMQTLIAFSPTFQVSFHKHTHMFDSTLSHNQFVRI